MTEVIEVQTKRDLNDFLSFPLTLYADDPFFVPPLLSQMRKHFSDRNPFFAHARVRCYLARREGRIRGRIASIINRRHIEFHRENVGFFGFYESIDDVTIAAALLDIVARDLRSEGLDTMRGPMNFSTNEECGFLIQGFDSHPFLMTPYNPPYYHLLMEANRLRKVKDLYAYILDIPDELPQKIHRVADLALRAGITVRNLRKNTFESDMRIFKHVYISAWEKNWGFIPLSDEELIYLGRNLKPIVKPDLVVIAEKNGEPVGFMGMLPDFNAVLKHLKGKLGPLNVIKAMYYARKITDLRMLLLGVKAEYRNKGVEALLFREGFTGVKKGGYRRVEFSWILEDNIPVQRLVEMIGGTLYKKYRIYEKEL